MASNTSCNGSEPKHGRTKHIMVWENGDFYGDGHTLAINPNYYRTWNGILALITDILKPSFGAVRNLIHWESKETVGSFDSLEPQGKYIAVGNEKLKQAKNCYKTPSERQNAGPSRRYYRENESNEPSTSRISLLRNRRTILFVMANGKTQEMPCKVVLTESDIDSWTMILDYIARSLDIPEGVQFLYTVFGDVVVNPRDIQNGCIYVAVAINEAFVPMDYVHIFKTLLPMREIDLKRVESTSAHPPSIGPLVASERNIEVAKSKSEGLTSVRSKVRSKAYCYSSFRRSLENPGVEIEVNVVKSKQSNPGLSTSPTSNIENPFLTGERPSADTKILMDRNFSVDESYYVPPVGSQRPSTLVEERQASEIDSEVSGSVSEKSAEEQVMDKISSLNSADDDDIDNYYEPDVEEPKVDENVQERPLNKSVTSILKKPCASSDRPAMTISINISESESDTGNRETPTSTNAGTMGCETSPKGCREPPKDKPKVSELSFGLSVSTGARYCYQKTTGYQIPVRSYCDSNTCGFMQNLKASLTPKVDKSNKNCISQCKTSPSVEQEPSSPAVMPSNDIINEETSDASLESEETPAELEAPTHEELVVQTAAALVDEISRASQVILKRSTSTTTSPPKVESKVTNTLEHKQENLGAEPLQNASESIPECCKIATRLMKFPPVIREKDSVKSINKPTKKPSTIAEVDEEESSSDITSGNESNEEKPKAKEILGMPSSSNWILDKLRASKHVQQIAPGRLNLSEVPESILQVAIEFVDDIILVSENIVERSFNRSSSSSRSYDSKETSTSEDYEDVVQCAKEFTDQIVQISEKIVTESVAVGTVNLPSISRGVNVPEAQEQNIFQELKVPSFIRDSGRFSSRQASNTSVQKGSGSRGRLPSAASRVSASAAKSISKDALLKRGASQTSQQKLPHEEKAQLASKSSKVRKKTSFQEEVGSTPDIKSETGKISKHTSFHQEEAGEVPDFTSKSDKISAGVSKQTSFHEEEADAATNSESETDKTSAKVSKHTSFHKEEADALDTKTVRIESLPSEKKDKSVQDILWPTKVSTGSSVKDKESDSLPGLNRSGSKLVSISILKPHSDTPSEIMPCEQNQPTQLVISKPVNAKPSILVQARDRESIKDRAPEEYDLLMLNCRTCCNPYFGAETGPKKRLNTHSRIMDIPEVREYSISDNVEYSEQEQNVFFENDPTYGNGNPSIVTVMQLKNKAFPVTLRSVSVENVLVGSSLEFKNSNKSSLAKCYCNDYGCDCKFDCASRNLGPTSQVQMENSAGPIQKRVDTTQSLVLQKKCLQHNVEDDPVKTAPLKIPKLYLSVPSIKSITSLDGLVINADKRCSDASSQYSDENIGLKNNNYSVNAKKGGESTDKSIEDYQSARVNACKDKAPLNNIVGQMGNSCSMIQLEKK